MVRVVISLLSLTLACEAAGPGGRAAAQREALPGCTVLAGPVALPRVLFETSGLARGVRDSTIFWTHNDGQAPVVFALDADGRVAGEVPLELPALADWEDLESTRCGDEPCLLVADIGDNDAKRPTIAVHEVAEPAPGGAAPPLLRTLTLRYPDGARDAEALFALPGGDRYIVTKGRHGPVALYRIPAAAAEGGVLEHVREITPEPAHEDDRVTAASASPDGRWVAVRSYRTLLLFTAGELLGGGPPAAEYDLSGLGEEQGEAVVLDAAGGVWLTSESETGGAPSWVRLSCPLPQVPAR